MSSPQKPKTKKNKPAKSKNTDNSNSQPTIKAAKRRNNKQRKNRARNQKQKKYAPNIYSLDNHATARAEGSRPNIMINVPLEAMAVETYFCSILSVALASGFNNTVTNPAYWAYVARTNDLILLLKGQTPSVPSRLSYENYINASYSPKTVPFRTGTISTSWTNTDSITTPNMISVRGYNYYMYVPSNAQTASKWDIMVAPGVPSDIEQASPILANVYNVCANDLVPHLKYTTRVDLEPDYARDISGFGANAVYYGSGNCQAGGPIKSAEWEVPVRAPMLSCMSTLQEGSERVACHLKPTGGDSTFVSGVALLPGFAMEAFRTKIPPVFCYLDLDEIVTWLLAWYRALLLQASKQSAIVDSDGEPYSYFLQMPCTAQQFRIAIRQAVLSMFVQSQACSQFITYSEDNNGFEPFRVGTNCHSMTRNQIVVPQILNENLRMLLPKFLGFGGKLERSHNQQIYIPVWGVYKANVNQPVSVLMSLWYPEGNNLQEMEFFPSYIADDDPNIIDGRNSNNVVCDLNSSLVGEILAEWNDRIDQLQQWSCSTCYMGGASNGSLLYHTRYAVYKTGVDVNLSTLSSVQLRRLNKQFVVKRKLERTKSNKVITPDKEEKFYVPPNSSLWLQYSNSFSSISTITETIKQAFNYFVFPTVVQEPAGEIPTIRQVRTATKQCQILELVKDGDELLSFNSRATKLFELGSKCAPGVATGGKSDELFSVLQTLSDMGKGGFFGDLAGAIFPEVAHITKLLPI